MAGMAPSPLDVIFASRRCNGRDGNVALLFALLFPVIALTAGAGLDFQRWQMQKARLQDFADTLAIRGGREFLLANADPARIESLVEAIAESDLSKSHQIGAFEIEVEADAREASVTVNLIQERLAALTLPIIDPSAHEIAAAATAVASGARNVCVVALDESASRTVEASFNARLDAAECAIMSNSTSSTGVYASGTAKVTSSLLCSAGGYSGASSNYEPAPTTDCPRTQDPLSERTAPPYGGCDYRDKMVGSRDFTTFTAALKGSFGESAGGDDTMARQEYTLEPGVYCGGLTVGSNARAILSPGVYVMKDGPLTIDLNGAIAGEGVSFVMDGNAAVFLFSPDSKIELSAAKEGLTAGILFFEGRDSTAKTHSILSNDARKLLGTFYLPNSTLFVSTFAPVADQSAYTAIVAKKLRLAGSPTLVLNTDYALTDVPVPAGLGPVGGEVFLRD